MPLYTQIQKDRPFNRSTQRDFQKAMVIQFRIPTIACSNVQHQAGPRLIQLPTKCATKCLEKGD